MFMELAENELVMIDVVTESVQADDPADEEWRDSRDLEMLQNLDQSLSFSRLNLKTILRHLRSSSREGRIQSSRLVYVPVPTLAAAAPSATGSEVAVKYSLEASAGGGINITLGWFGAEAGVKVTIAQDFKIVCQPGQVKVLCVLLPFIHEVRLVRPPGGEEEFPVDRLVPVTSFSQVGAQQRTGELADLLTHVTDRSPWSAEDGGLESSASKKVGVETKLALEFKFTEASKLGVTGSMAGSIGVAVDFKVPKGEFELAWLDEPAGAALIQRA